MKYHGVGLVLSMLLLFFGSPASGRQNAEAFILRGKILTEEGEPIAHANIAIDRKGVATATNVAGLFALAIPAANAADTLKFSCIGFYTKYMAVSDLQGKTEITVTLQKHVTELNEVTVAYYDPQKILQKAIQHIEENYIDHPHVLRGFYRMYTYADTVPLQLSEAVFDVYNFGYADKRADQFKLLKARNERNDRDFASLELGQKPNSVFEDDIINHRVASGFLSDEGMSKHDFKVSALTDFQGYQAYEFDFKEKPGVTEGAYRGRFYVDAKTYAFIYFDFGVSPAALGDAALGSFISKALVRNADSDIRLTEDQTRVTYQEVGHQWVLAHVEGDHSLAIRNPGATGDLVAHVKFNYQVTAVDTDVKDSFSSKLDRNATIGDHSGSDDPKFWAAYNILLPDYDAEALFRQIKLINKSVKLK